MTSKQNELLSKKQPFDHSDTNNSSSKFLNFNLNQNQKCSNVFASPIQSFSKSYNGKNYDGYTVIKNSEENKKSWNISTKNFSLNSSKLTLFNEAVKDERNQKRWKNDKKDKNASSSTLSLHIAAYESFMESANSNDEIQDLPKKAFNISKLPLQTNQDCFEFPRQMDNNESGIPEIQQFSASQKLLSLNLDVEAVARRMLSDGPHRYRIPAEFLLSLLDQVEPLFRREPTLLRLNSPIFVVGDLHGQYSDLLRVFQRCGVPFDGEKFLFLGDIVDRGKHSLECLTLLLCLKAKFPRQILILRGNHEISSVNKTYGFYAEIRQRFARSGQWQIVYDRINRLFSYLPLAALVNLKLLCLHGGLSPELTSLSQIEAISRPLIEPSGLAECLLWSDPEPGISGFAPNKSRGVAYIFGKDAVEEKCEKLGVEKIIRGHQLVDAGFDVFGDGKVITIFTATSYHETFNNYGGVAKIDRNGGIEILQLPPQYPMTDDERSDPIEG